ncbi:MAG: hypothetical protein ABIQ18_27460 [Umezawaea sp.]
MEQKAPVATTTPTAKVEPAKPTAKVEPSTKQAETKEREAFRAALPPREEFAKAVLADLQRNLRDLIATDPDLKGVTKADLAAWVAADIDEAFAGLAKPGWGES